MRIYKKSDTADAKGMNTVQNGMTVSAAAAKSEVSTSSAHHMHHCNKQVTARLLPREATCTWNMLSTESQRSFLKLVMEKPVRKKDAKEQCVPQSTGQLCWRSRLHGT